MVRFLSDRWFDDMNRLAALDDGVRAATAGVTLTIGQVVTRPGSEDVAYSVRIDDGRLRVEPGPSPSADVVMVTGYHTAAAVARGELTSAQALEQGLLKLRGNVRLLARHHDALARVGDAFAPLREQVEY